MVEEDISDPESEPEDAAIIAALEEEKKDQQAKWNAKHETLVAAQKVEHAKRIAHHKAVGILTMEEYERHPLAIAADYRKMTPAEFDGLMASMKDKGQFNPLVFYQGKVLDGWNRITALTKLNIPVSRWKIVEPKFKNDSHAKAVMEALNAHRRHETMEDKKKRALKLIAENSKVTNRKVALAIGIDDKTVAKIRREAKASSEIPNDDDTRVDKLGRKIAAHKKRVPVTDEAKAAAAAKKAASSNWKGFLEHLTTYLDTLGQDEVKLKYTLKKIDEEIVRHINGVLYDLYPYPPISPRVEYRMHLESSYEQLQERYWREKDHIGLLMDPRKIEWWNEKYWSRLLIVPPSCGADALEAMAPGLLAKEDGDAEEQKSA